VSSDIVSLDLLGTIKLRDRRVVLSMRPIHAHRPASLVLAVLAMAWTCSCGPPPDLRSFAEHDLLPPVLLEAASQAPSEIELTFQEPVVAAHAVFGLVPTIAISSVACTGDRLTIALSGSLVPGGRYLLEGTVADEAGNTMKFITEIYGYNPHVPRLCINEFTTQGSGGHPDIVELYVSESGDLAGVVVYEGTDEEWLDRLVFPSVPVREGDYVLVHFKPEGITEETDETVDRAQSGGRDASDEAWDFWVESGDGLSGNNGALTVYRHVDGALIDAVLYSNRSSDSDEHYRGFGSRRVMAWADSLGEAGAWHGVDAVLRPEDAVDPEGSTGTRSVCRSSGSDDTDTKHDWHIVPTRGATYGSRNTDDVYEP
jgi:hypothetical protein